MFLHYYSGPAQPFSSVPSVVSNDIILYCILMQSVHISVTPTELSIIHSINDFDIISLQIF